MARKKRTRNASGIGAVSVPEGSESILEKNEVEDMEEQELCACGHLAEACECKHKCEFECNDEECAHQEVQAVVEAEPAVEEAAAEEAVVEPEPVAEVVEHVEELPVAEPETVVAVVEPVVIPVVPEPAVVLPVAKAKAAAPVVVAPAPAPVSQTANKFASILGEKSGAARRYLSGRTRY